jgi:hypothetical protein
MTRRVHTDPGRRESARAAEAYRRYRDLGAGRSLSKLHEQFQRQAAESRQNGGKTPMPPTTSKQMLEEWSACFGWVGRVAAWEAEVDFACRQEQLRQTQEQARQNAALLQQVGAGSLSIAALTLNQYVDARTGELLQPIPLRDLPQLMRAGAELIQLAVGSPTSIFTNTGDTTQLERCLRESDEQTRAAVLNGLRAALAWHERTKQGGA